MVSLKIKFILIVSVVSVGVALAASAYAQIETFNVDSSYDWRGRSEISATLRHEGGNAHWYISDSYWVGLNSAQQANLLVDVASISKEFDAVIYPKIRAVFGSENKPGIDNDSKIYILLTRMIEDAGGYFREQDGFSPDVVEGSNGHEMLYLNIRHLGNQRMPSFLAHEFQHLITFNQKTIKHGLREEVWINELRSEIAPTLLGYDSSSEYAGSNLEARVKAFLKDPVDAILNWQNEPKDYGATNLFGQYVLDHYGRSVIATMIANERIGMDSFNAALRSFGFEEDFSDIFTNWSIAALVNDCSLNARDLYCYKNPSLDYDTLHITFDNVFASGINTIEQTRSSLEWEANWFEFAKNLQTERPEKHILRLEFSSPLNSGFRVPYVAYGENKSVAKETKEMSLYRGSGEFYVEDFGFKVPRVVIIPSNQYGISSTIGKNAPKTAFDFTATLVEEVPETEPSSAATLNVGSEEGVVQLPDFMDGTLIRASGDYKVYIIKGGYKRWIQASQIFDFYGHLNFDVVQVVSQETLALYKDSWLVRAAGEEKVYEINGDGTRHWLDMTPEKFAATGRLWDMVYVINKTELSWYVEGPSVE